MGQVMVSMDDSGSRVIINRVGKYRDIFENIENIGNIRYFRYFRYIYQAFAHTLLKLYEIYYQIIVCVCALHIR